ncbi:hypothetical protein RCH14_003409 [Massilia sp. MP_M2]|uniref:hypothetical protein n=1 Tax=Massilia sp. MP_M2 TaxID=3071713 RepID=UPI00319DEF48
MLAIVVSHAHPAGKAMDLRFIPSLETTAMLLREALLLRHTPDGAELWRNAAQAWTAQGRCTVLPLVFQVFTRNARLQSCTDWPVALPLRYVSVAGNEQMHAETLAGSGASRRPFLSVEIDHRPARDGACATYRIALASTITSLQAVPAGELPP